jgi:serralysin
MLKAAREDLMSTAFRVTLEGTQEVPPNTSTASGFGTIIFDSVAVEASYSITIEGVDYGPITGDKPQTKATDDDVVSTHFHGPAPRGANASVVFGQKNPDQDNDDLSIVLNKDDSWTVSGVWERSDPANSSINNFAGVLGSATVGTEVPLYFNVHTREFPMGEIRGQLVAIADDNNNVVRGTAGNDLLPGLGGNDTIVGLAGDDTLLGGIGNDVIDGGVGKDVIDGGVGNDRLTGGEDADLFVFNAGFGMDTITDLKNQDQIQFADGLFEDRRSVLEASEQVGDDVVIRLDANNTITLLDVTLNTLQASDFLT